MQKLIFLLFVSFFLIPVALAQSVAVDKTVQGSSQVNISDAVSFRINVTNTGANLSTDNLTNAVLNDTFNTSFLNFTNAATLFGSGVVVDISNAVSGIVAWTFNVSVNESILVEINFTTLLAGNTTNNVSVSNGTELNTSSANLEVVPDTQVPTITLIVPANATNTTNNVTFNCSVSDDQGLANVTLMIWNNSGLLSVSNTTNISGTNSSAQWTNTISPDGNYTWNCLGIDSQGNQALSSSNRTFSVDSTAPTTTDDAPSGYQSSAFNVTLNASDNGTGVNHTSFRVNNGSWQNGTIVNITVEGNHTIEYFSVDYSGNTESTNTVNAALDTTTPIISSVSSGTPSTTSATITWTTNESANSSVNYGTSISLGSVNSSASTTTSHSRILFGLSSSTTYYYNVTSCDSAGNCNTSGPNSFTTDAEATSSGGGGGGSISAGTHLTSNPQRVSLSKFGSYYFRVSGDTTRHTIRIDSIANDNVTFTIQSDPVTVTLKDGESADIDVTDDNKADMILTLVSHTSNQAILSVAKYSGSTPTTNEPEVNEVEEDANEPVMETISEPEAPLDKPQTENSLEEAVPVFEDAREGSSWLVWLLALLIVIIGTAAYIIHRPEYHKELHDYIHTALHVHGKSEEQIHEEVAKAGWDKKAVHRHMKRVKRSRK